MKVKLKKWMEKMTRAVNQPPVKAVPFDQALTSKGTGVKTAAATINIPSGYAVVPHCRPISPYISGDATVYITDRDEVIMNGNTASFTYYLHNPNNYTGPLNLGASILCYRVGGYCVTQLFQGLQRFSHRSCLGVM